MLATGYVQIQQRSLQSSPARLVIAPEAPRSVERWEVEGMGDYSAALADALQQESISRANGVPALPEVSADAFEEVYTWFLA